jgi:hypothetical protein
MDEEITQQISNRTRKQDRRTQVAIIAVVLMILFGVLAIASFIHDAREQQQIAVVQEERAEEAVGAVDQLCAQVEELGRSCVVNPEDLRGEQGDPGQPGEPGEEGDPGQEGEQGEQGEEGEPGQPGEEGQPGPTGQPGEPGQPGTPGEPGQPGQDGAPGEPGEPGQPGLPGQDGQPGQDGEDGEPPTSFTFPCESILEPDRVCICLRDVDSPDEAPTYTCQPVVV